MKQANQQITKQARPTTQHGKEPSKQGEQKTNTNQAANKQTAKVTKPIVPIQRFGCPALSAQPMANFSARRASSGQEDPLKCQGWSPWPPIQDNGITGFVLFLCSGSSFQRCLACNLRIRCFASDSSSKGTPKRDFVCTLLHAVVESHDAQLLAETCETRSGSPTGFL